MKINRITDKIGVLTALAVLKSTTVLASHQQTTAGAGPSLPTQETLPETALYLFLPFLASVFFLNEVMQFYLRRKYSGTSLKDAEDYIGYTLIGSAFVVFLLSFSRLFHSLPHVATEVFVAVVVAPVMAGIGLKYWEEIRQKLDR